MCLSCVQYAFAARLEDGGVVAWGDENNGGYIPPAKVAAAADLAGIDSNATFFDVADVEDVVACSAEELPLSIELTLLRS